MRLHRANIVGGHTHVAAQEKRAFGSREEAERFAGTRHPGARLKAYRCVYCGSWHLKTRGPKGG